MIRSTFANTALIGLASFSVLLTACGGGGGGSSASNERRAEGLANGESDKPLTLSLGAPSSNPSVLPPSDSVTKVTFLSVASGTAHPENLILDEVDRNGNPIKKDIARLADDGEGVDLNRGDRIYSGSLLISSLEATEKFYQVRGTYQGKVALSGTGSFWVSRCSSQARPSDSNQAVDDSRSDAIIYANEVSITVGDNVRPNVDTINALVADIGGEVVGCIPSLRQYLLEFPGNNDASGVYDAIATLTQKPEITGASPNAQTLNLPGSKAAQCYGKECQWYLERIRAPEAWTIGGGGDAQTSVGVIDFGVDCTHPDLNCNGNVYNKDLIDHGTGVAGLIAANRTNGSDLIGVAWNSFLFPYNFRSNTGSQYKMSELIVSSLKEDNIRVINISAATAIDTDNLLRDAICSAIDSGRLVVAAAGNAYASKGCRMEDVYPAKYNSIGTCPSGADLQSGLLVVGASDANNNLAHWDDNKSCSNTEHVDVYAPGKDIYTASAVTNYSSRDGTSYATPLASGSAALLWASTPSATASEIHDILKISASTLSTTSTNDRTKTSDARMSNQPLLDIYLAVGGDDIIDPDVSPTPFGFTSVLNSIPGRNITSNRIEIRGIDSKAPISITSGYYSIDNGPFTNAAGSIGIGQNLRIQTRAGSPGTTRQTTVTVGDFSASFSVISSPDSDGDGIADAQEELQGTSPSSADSDGDGIDDGFELANGLNPNGSNQNVDSDGDGLTDLEEFEAGTDPNSADSDGDGIPDAEDDQPNFNPSLLIPVLFLLQ